MIFTGKHLYWGLFFSKDAGLQASNCIKKGLKNNIFFCKYQEIDENTYFE